MQLSWRCARLPSDQNLCSLQNIHHAASTITANTSHSNRAKTRRIHLPVLPRPLDAYHLCLEVSRHLLYLNTCRQPLFRISLLLKPKDWFRVQIKDNTRLSFLSFGKMMNEHKLIISGTFVMLFSLTVLHMTLSHLFWSHQVQICVILGKVKTSCDFRFCHCLMSSDVLSSICNVRQ